MNATEVWLVDLELRTIEQMLEPGEDFDLFMLKCRQDPKIFLNRLIGLSEPVKDFHVEWFNAFLNKKRSCVQAFRGCGKTEILGPCAFLYIALFKRDKQMLVVSRTLDMSKDIIRRARNYIETNEILQKLRPIHHELAWTKVEISTTTGCVLFCKPYSDNIRTWHVNYVFMDECGFYEDKTIYYYTIVPILQFKNANLMAASTPRTLIDLISELYKKFGKKAEEDPDNYFVAKYPIMIGNVPVWPEKYNGTKIAEIKEDCGSMAKFEREYMCKVVSEDSVAIQIDKILAACDDTLSMKIVGADDGYERFAGFDFAISASGNYSVYVVLKKVDNRMIIEYMERLRGQDYKFQEMRIKDIYKNFNIVNGLGDNGSFGRIMVEDLISDGVNLMGFDTQGKKEDLFVGVLKKFAHDKPGVIIPTSDEDPYTKSMSDAMIKELSEITPEFSKTGIATYGKLGAYNDCVVALGLAIMAAGEAIEVEPMIEFL